MRSDLWKLWPAGLALAVAIGVTVFGYMRLELPRFSNLDLTEPGLRSTYLVLHKTEPERCFVVGRRSATMRRSDRKQPGRNWDCLRLGDGEDGSEGATWLLRSKRIGEGTVFLVPAEDVSDWTYPFLYDFVRERGETDLPEVYWTHLYVSRIYEGLYLRVSLPFDRRKKDGGSGILRELLAIRDGVLTVLDTRFRTSRGLYVSAVAGGVFPELREPAPELAWLAARAPTRETVLLMSNVEPFAPTLLPLPVSLLDLYALQGSDPPATFRDGRYRRWTHGPWRTSAATASPFSEEEWHLLEERFARYRQQLRGALVAQATVEQTLGQLEPNLSARQIAVADLGLSLAP